ncbi:hypothetical protein BVRB_2g024060 [Beta vulgaris subsp. vulgaris]|nr:hypothetical protein BVRB_2g024060 [Beta vulgaris subsp. vulgaris]
MREEVNEQLSTCTGCETMGNATFVPLGLSQQTNVH